MISYRIKKAAVACLAGMLFLATATTGFAAGAALQPLSISMEDYPYPYPVSFLPLTIEGQELRMAYMDVAAQGKPNGKTVVLLHGKNFFGAYWSETIKVLSRNGYRVVVPDQIGFGKSSRPDIHYSFHLLAANTRKLLDSLGIREATVMGHSMGGMLATRFVLMYPERVTALVMENPIGLEDYRLLVPWVPVEEAYRAELATSEETIRKYLRSYFVNWKPEYEEYGDVQVRMRMSGEFPRQALASALTYQMIYEQPVSYEFPNVRARTLLLIGQSDRTVVGKARVPKELLPLAGNYPELGRKTARLVPQATLIEFPDVGHLPRFEVPARYHGELLRFLAK